MSDQNVIREEQDYYMDEEPYPAYADDEELTHQPQSRRRVGRLSVGLAALLIAGLGFIGGVLVQKGQEDEQGGGTAAQVPGTAGAGGGPSAAGGRQAGGGAGAGRGGVGGGQAPTAGEVKSKSGNVLYIEGADGNTVKVLLNGQSEVTRTAKSSAKRIHPGDTVIVQGAKAKNGQVKATSVSATAAGAGGSGFPGASLGGGTPGGAPPSGGAGGAGGAQGLPALPAPPGGG